MQRSMIGWNGCLARFLLPVAGKDTCLTRYSLLPRHRRQATEIADDAPLIDQPAQVVPDCRGVFGHVVLGAGVLDIAG